MLRRDFGSRANGSLACTVDSGKYTWSSSFEPDEEPRSVITPTTVSVNGAPATLALTDCPNAACGVPNRVFATCAPSTALAVLSRMSSGLRKAPQPTLRPRTDGMYSSTPMINDDTFWPLA